MSASLHRFFHTSRRGLFAQHRQQWLGLLRRSHRSVPALPLFARHRHEAAAARGGGGCLGSAT